MYEHVKHSGEYRQGQGTGVPAAPVATPTREQFLYQREAAIKVILFQSFAVMFFVLIGWMLIGLKFGEHPYGVDWGKLLSSAALAAWVAGFGYLGYSLWRWSKLAWLENLLGVNLDRDPRVGNGGKEPTMFIKVQYPDGNVRVANTGLFEKNKRYLIAVARATVHGRPNSQQAMKRSDRIPRPKHEKVMSAFVQLGVLRKEKPDQSNSRYVVAEPVAANTEVLKAIANGDFRMLEEVWAESQ